MLLRAIAAAMLMRDERVDYVDDERDRCRVEHTSVIADATYVNHNGEVVRHAPLRATRYTAVATISLSPRRRHYCLLILALLRGVICCYDMLSLR